MAAGDIKLVYGTQEQPTFGVGSLASSSTLLTGYETGIVDNSSGLYLDFHVSGFSTVGTTVTADTVIELWCFGQNEDTPDYPGPFDGTAGASTSFNSDGEKNSLMTLIAVLDVDTTTADRTYYFNEKSIAAAFGGYPPKRFGFWVTHNTGSNLNSTASNHELNVLPIYEAQAQA